MGFIPVDLLPFWFWALTVTLFGLAIGSFLNVVIYRVPLRYYGEDDESEEPIQPVDQKASPAKTDEDRDKVNEDKAIVKEAKFSYSGKNETPAETVGVVAQTETKDVEDAQTKAKHIEATEDIKDAEDAEDEEYRRLKGLFSEEELSKISIFYPTRSFCPNCRHQITALENIPVISYLVLGGKCSGCKIHISAIYPFVEALTAAGFFLALYKQSTSAVFSVGTLVFDALFIATMITLIFIDFNHMILPNVITYPGTVIAIGVRLLLPTPATPEPSFFAVQFSLLLLIMLALFTTLILWGQYQIFKLILAILLFGLVIFLLQQSLDFEWYLDMQGHFIAQWEMLVTPRPWLGSMINGLLGMVFGAGILLTLRQAYYAVRGVEGMGLGDVKMMLMVGMYLGWANTIGILVLAAFLGVFIALGMVLRDGSKAMRMRIPFGVFLGAASIIMVLYGNQIISWYIEHMITRNQ